MTLVMVTHDLYLKNFADRVIWMRDGKIAKIEVVPAEKRLAAQNALKTKLEEVLIIFYQFSPKVDQKQSSSRVRAV